MVTRMDCLSRALSETPDGKKFKIESNGRWNMSAGGRGTPGDLIPIDDIVRVRRLVTGFSRIASSSLEYCGELGVLSDTNRNTVGRGKDPEVISISASEDSCMPLPPVFRQTRAIRSAHSRIVTNRTAPASSSARGSDNRKIWIAGNADVMFGGWLVARIKRDDSNCCDCKNGCKSLRDGT